jgi:hypothetical protein
MPLARLLARTLQGKYPLHDGNRVRRRRAAGATQNEQPSLAALLRDPLVKGLKDPMTEAIGVRAPILVGHVGS